MLDEEEYEVMSKYLSDMLDEIVEKYGYNIDLDEEYEDLLEFIYRNVVRVWFKGKRPSIIELENRLKEVRRREKRKLAILLSYYISKYIRAKKVLTLR